MTLKLLSTMLLGSLFSLNLTFAGTPSTNQINDKKETWTLYSIVNTTHKSSYNKYIYTFDGNELSAKRLRSKEYEKTNLINKVYHQDYLAIYDDEQGNWAYKVHNYTPLAWTLSVLQPKDDSAEPFTISFEKIDLSDKSIGEYLTPFEYSLNFKNPNPYQSSEWNKFKAKLQNAKFPKGSICLKTIIDSNISEIAPLAPMIAVDKNMKDYDVKKQNIVQMFTDEFYNAVKQNSDSSKEAQISKFILDQETFVCDYYNQQASQAIEQILF